MLFVTGWRPADLLPCRWFINIELAKSVKACYLLPCRWFINLLPKEIALRTPFTTV